MVKRYDLHIHTTYSGVSSNLKVRDLLKIAKKVGLTGIAITDYNTIKGAVKASKLNKDKDFEIIIGSEITTKQGHLLLYYLNKEIKSNDLFEVIDKAKNQGALIFPAHPFDITRDHLLIKDLMKIKNKIHGIETFNSRSINFFANIKAKSFAKKFNLAGIGGSDAHFSFEIGKGQTILKDNLRKAVKKNKLDVTGTIIYGIPGHFKTRLKEGIIKSFIKEYKFITKNGKSV